MSQLLEEQCNVPILYITGQTKYSTKGVLRKDVCNSQNLWDEISAIQDVKKLLCEYENKQKPIEDITPFRTILHKVKHIKMQHNQKYGMNGSLEGIKYIALMWVPTVFATDKKYTTFINVLRDNEYFCNKLNEECIYISGPKYGNLENNNWNKHIKLEELDIDQQFDLNELATITRKYSMLPQDKDRYLKIEIAVHKVAKEASKQKPKLAKSTELCCCWSVKNVNVNRKNIPRPVDLTTQQSSSFESESCCCFPKIHNEPLRMSLLDQSTQSKSIATTGRMRFRSSPYKFNHEPKPSDVEEIYTAESGLTHTRPVFALVWLKYREKNIRLLSNIDDDEKKVNNDEDELVIDAELPALSVMKHLHLLPYNNGLHCYHVEIFNYEESYENLDLVIDREIMWSHAFSVFIQFMFLPFFVLFPPKKIIQYFNKNFKIKPQTRPIEYVKLEQAEEVLDPTEMITYDITALWRPHISVDKRSFCGKEWVFRLISFIITSILYSIIMVGPFLYRRAVEYEDNNLLFFDSMGPFLFYVLLTFTVVWWSCARRDCISPKEHELLYYQLIANRPKKRKERDREVKRTDWAPLVNISDTDILTTFIYAYRKGFFELRTPTHVLLSSAPLKRCKSTCTSLKTIALFLILIMVYFSMQNLERFEQAQVPWYINPNEKYFKLKIIYIILSNLLSIIFAFGFILLWETMFHRIKRYRDNVRTLTNLIIKNPYSEYASLSRIDNILSWLALERFVKRKALMLFASLETPLLSLWILTVASWSATIYCLYEGHGLKKYSKDSIISNSALAIWGSVALFSLFQTVRMLVFYGRRFSYETIKQDNALKSQCGTMQRNNLMKFLANDQSTKEQQRVIKAAPVLLQHIVHDEIVPKVFGVKFDHLAAKAMLTAFLSAIPTMVSLMKSRIDQK
eukprot:295726_1